MSRSVPRRVHAGFADLSLSSPFFLFLPTPVLHSCVVRACLFVFRSRSDPFSLSEALFLSREYRESLRKHALALLFVLLVCWIQRWRILFFRGVLPLTSRFHGGTNTRAGAFTTRRRAFFSGSLSFLSLDRHFSFWLLL